MSGTNGLGSSILRETISGPANWNVSQLIADPTWVIELEERHRRELSSAVERLEGVGPLATLDRQHFDLPSLGPVLDSLIEVIEGGAGVALIRNVPVEGRPREDLERLFWGLACHIGHPDPQDVSGTLLHHVSAEQEFERPADLYRALREQRDLRGYQTNGPLAFHNDGSDALMFLCCEPAVIGGITRIASATNAFNTVISQDKYLASVLQSEFIFDARGQNSETIWQKAPIFSFYDNKLNVLYKRGYIDLAQGLNGVPPLSSDQISALDALDSALNRPDNAFEFRMDRGDLLIANNYSILHGRSHFHNASCGGPRRHMMRIWATLRRNRRALPPSLRATREFAAAWARRISFGDENCSSDCNR